MAFNYDQGLRGNGAPVLKYVIINDSVAAQVGMAYKAYTNGYADIATASKQFLGFSHSIVDKYGIGILPTKATKANLGSATLDDNNNPTIVTVASTNHTTDKITVALDVSLDSIYSASQNGTVGTTNSSGNIGGFIDIATGGLTLTETSCSRSAVKQCYIWGTDPNDSTRILVSICQSERLGGNF